MIKLLKSVKTYGLEVPVPIIFTTTTETEIELEEPEGVDTRGKVLVIQRFCQRNLLEVLYKFKFYLESDEEEPGSFLDILREKDNVVFRIGNFTTMKVEAPDELHIILQVNTQVNEFKVSFTTENKLYDLLLSSEKGEILGKLNEYISLAITECLTLISETCQEISKLKESKK